MKRMMAIVLCAFVIAAMMLQAPEAQAQRRTSTRGGAAGPLEFTVMYGNMWGGHIDSNVGTFRVDTGDSWTLAASMPIRSGMWGDLSYTRQGSRINLDTRTSTSNLTDMTVHYWQLGALQGLPRGNFVPYVIGTLGLTYYSPEAGNVDIGDVTYRADSVTKFSMAFGVGIKAVMGPDQRIGFRAQFRVLPTLYDTGAGIWFGSGGGGVSVSGSAIWQYEVAAGLTVKLGR